MKVKVILHKILKFKTKNDIIFTINTFLRSLYVSSRMQRGYEKSGNFPS